jgi:HlyD family secretion protein
MRRLRHVRGPNALVATGTLAALAVFVSPCCASRGDPSLMVMSGHVEATDVRLSTKVGGRLESFTLVEGDRVEAGQEVARIDTVDIRLALDAARADRGQAEAELALRVKGPRVEEIAEAEAHFKAAEAEVGGARLELKRMQDLLDSGSGTPKARDDARTRGDVAQASLDAASERLRKLKAGTRREEIDAARARLSAAEARIAQLEQQIKDALIVSPVAGIVTEKLTEQGELLAAGVPIAVVTDLDRPWLTVYVGEPDLGRIRIGQEAEVVTDGGEKRTGRISFVASQAEFTPKNVQTRDERVKLVYRVKIELANADGLFKPGMPAEARLRSVEAGG